MRPSARVALILGCIIILLPLLFLRYHEGAGPEPAERFASRPRWGGIFRRPLLQEPATLDPAHITGVYGSAVAQQVHEGLVQFDRNLNVVPAIARSWTASRDGRTWTFFLRPRVRFHHGREVVARDFVYSFTRILNPRTRSELAGLFDRIAGAREFEQGKAARVRGLEAVDRYTLRIRLSQPFSPFLDLLGMSQAKVVPRELVEGREAAFGRHPVGAGPFKFVRWERGKRIVLEANEDYYEGRPLLDRVEFRIYAGLPDEKILSDFRQGRLDSSYLPAGVDDAWRRQLPRSEGYRFIRKPVLSLLFWGMNTARAPFNDRRVRKALNYAVDVRALNDSSRGGRFDPARGILPPGMAGFDPQLQGYEYSPEKSRALLAQASPRARAALAHLQLWTNETSRADCKEYEILTKNLADLGVKATIKVVTERSRYESALKRGTPLLYRYAWFADYPDPDDLFRGLLTPGGGYDFSRYANGRVIALLGKARRERDDLKRVGLYRRAERQILEDAPWVPLFHQTFEQIFQPYVRGIEVNALGERFIPMKRIWFERRSRAARAGK